MSYTALCRQGQERLGLMLVSRSITLPGVILGCGRPHSQPWLSEAATYMYPPTLIAKYWPLIFYGVGSCHGQWDPMMLESADVVMLVVGVTYELRVKFARRLQSGAY